jgi:hypothetical protein
MGPEMRYHVRPVGTPPFSLVPGCPDPSNPKGFVRWQAGLRGEGYRAVPTSHRTLGFSLPVSRCSTGEERPDSPAEGVETVHLLDLDSRLRGGSQVYVVSAR